MAGRAIRASTLAACLAAAAGIVLYYPFARPVLGAILALYGVALWYRPALWLIVVPIVLPACDLTPWTGWLYVTESDLVLLVTLGVLAWRAPPARADFVLPRFPAAVVGVACVVCAVGVLRGLSAAALPGGSSNPYLQPDNALRIAKGFVWAIALLPFLRARLRQHGDAVRLFATGMVAGLACVALAAIVERALFPGLWNFHADYRVVATFAGMNVGSGDIGDYLAMAIPFLLLRPGGYVAMLAILPVAAGAGYALLATFSRRAYVAAVLMLLATIVGQALVTRRRGTSRTAWTVPALLLLGIVATFAVALDTHEMATRLRASIGDLVVREGNWTGGLDLMDDSLMAQLFGMGTGSFARTVVLRAPPGHRPTNFVVEQNGGTRFLHMRFGTPLYFGQKIVIAPHHTYRLTLAMRSPDGTGRLAVAVCDKLLLYSRNCRALRFPPTPPGAWKTVSASFASGKLGQARVLGLLARPVELALFGSGTSVDVADARLVDAADPGGANILRNADFAAGTQRWYFTDDAHLDWQIENQFLASYFAGGVLGLAALLLLVGTGIAGAIRAACRGDPLAVTLAASLLAFLCCSLFDAPLNTPRLATLAYLIAGTGVSLWTPLRA